MKRLVPVLFCICALVLLLAGCENIVNTETTLTVQNASANPQTFSVYDSTGGDLKGSYTIANGATENYTLRRGYTKSTPAKCVWEYTGGTWVIKDQTPQTVSATNNLSVQVTLQGINANIPVSGTITSGNSISVGVYSGPHNWTLNGQKTDSIGTYIESGADKIYFTIIYSGNLLISPK